MNKSSDPNDTKQGKKGNEFFPQWTRKILYNISTLNYPIDYQYILVYTNTRITHRNYPTYRDEIHGVAKGSSARLSNNCGLRKTPHLHLQGERHKSVCDFTVGKYERGENYHSLRYPAPNNAYLYTRLPIHPRMITFPFNLISQNQH